MIRTKGEAGTGDIVEAVKPPARGASTDSPARYARPGGAHDARRSSSGPASSS